MYDEDYPKCSTHTNPKARKRYECDECFHVIQPGERYHRLTGIWDHGPSRQITCEECHRVGEVVAPNGYIFGRLIEMAREALSECEDVPYDAPVKVWVDKWNAANAESRRAILAARRMESDARRMEAGNE